MLLKEENAHKLERFLAAQEYYYKIAKEELLNGPKTSHWIWFIFPQLKGLGYSEMSKYYGIDDSNEAKAYFENDILRDRLLEITNILLNHPYKSIFHIMGDPDDLKVQSCMTLFYLVTKEKVFFDVLHKYFDDKLDERTVKLLQK